jgi:importin-5
MGCEAIISLLERIPNVIKNKTDTLAKLIEMIFICMIQIDKELDDAWIKPPEGFNEDIEEDEDFEVKQKNNFFFKINKKKIIYIRSF